MTTAMRKRMCGTALILLAWGAALGAELDADAAPTRIEVHGHRGARGRMPENTIPAMDYALALGVDYLEMDLAVTKDMQLVLSHDPHINFKICLDPSGARIEKEKAPLIHDLMLVEVKKYDCGTLKNPRFPKQTPVPGTRIPTLDELFDFVQKSQLPAAKKVQFNIETKIFSDHPKYSVEPAVFAKLFIDTVARHGMLERTLLQSFDYRTIAEAKKIEPRLRTAALVESPFEDMAKTAIREQVQIISPNYELLTRAKVEKVHAVKVGDARVQVVPWTANDEGAWEKLVKQGVDAIISDDPESLIEFLKKKGLPQ